MFKNNFTRLTIWTAVNMTDIRFDEEARRGIGIGCPGLNVTQTLGNGTETRPITTADTGKMLLAGWLLFLFSQGFNFILYKMHPSSPEMWTWGVEEEPEEWTPPEETQEEGELIWVNNLIMFEQPLILIYQQRRSTFLTVENQNQRISLPLVGSPKQSWQLEKRMRSLRSGHHQRRHKRRVSLGYKINV